jgi:hypothetical protein
VKSIVFRLIDGVLCSDVIAESLEPCAALMAFGLVQRFVVLNRAEQGLSTLHKWGFFGDREGVSVNQNV